MPKRLDPDLIGAGILYPIVVEYALTDMLEQLEQLLYKAADAMENGSATRRRTLEVSAAGGAALALSLLLHSRASAQTVETVTQAADVVSKPILYHRGDKAYQTLSEPWMRFIAAHREASGEDATQYIRRFLDPWKDVTNPAWGICNGAANWRAFQPRETPDGVSLEGYSFTGEDIDTLFSSLFYQAAASDENLYGRIYQATGFCGTGGERSQPIFLNNMLWQHIGEEKRRIVVEISPNNREVWSYAIYKFSQSITHYSDGTSRFDTTMLGNWLIDNTLETGPEKVIRSAYRINDNDPNYQGGFIGENRVNRAWIPDPRSFAVVNGRSYQMENNAITPLMLGSMRRLFPFSETEWPSLTEPDLRPVFCG